MAYIFICIYYVLQAINKYDLKLMNDKYGSKLYKPNKPYHKMTIKELTDHCKICKSLDKMSHERIKKIENLDEKLLKIKIKKFLNRNNRLTKKHKKRRTKKTLEQENIQSVGKTMKARKKVSKTKKQNM